MVLLLFQSQMLTVKVCVNPFRYQGKKGNQRQQKSKKRGKQERKEEKRKERKKFTRALLHPLNSLEDVVCFINKLSLPATLLNPGSQDYLLASCKSTSNILGLARVVGNNMGAIIQRMDNHTTQLDNHSSMFLSSSA